MIRFENISRSASVGGFPVGQRAGRLTERLPAAPIGPAEAGYFIPCKAADARTNSLVERFLNKVAPPNAAGCALWTAKVDRDGYGDFWLDGKHNPAHRAAWTIFVGKIPDGMFVLHKCDVPACVNPEHLFLGSHQDNMDDMQRKGRRLCGAGLLSVLPKGQDAHLAKLSEADALEILRRRSVG